MGAMHTPDHLGTLIPKVYEGLTDENPWQGLLRALRDLTHSEVAAITLRQGDSQSAPLIIWDRLSPLTPEQVQQARRDHARLIQADPLCAALRQSGDLFTLDELVPWDLLKGTVYYQTLMQPYGIGHQIGLCFEDPRGWTCSIGLMRRLGDSPFGEAEKALLRPLLPHLEKALGIYTELQHSKAQRDVFEESLCRLGMGLLILNRQRQVIDCNAAARAMMEQGSGSGVELVNRRLVVQHNRVAVERAIDNALRASEHTALAPFTQTLRLNGPGKQPLGLLVRSLQSTPVLYQSDAAPRVVLYLSSAAPSLDAAHHTAPEQTLVNLFGLTRTEALTALMLCNGLTLVQIAERLNVTQNTARAYSKRIFAKMGIDRQVELVRIILKSVVVLV